MKTILMILVLIGITHSTELDNPYPNYNHTPVLWVVGTSIGYGLVACGLFIANNQNMVQSGCVVLGICIPIMTVKYVKHEKYLHYEDLAQLRKAKCQD